MESRSEEHGMFRRSFDRGDFERRDQPLVMIAIPKPCLLLLTAVLACALMPLSAQGQNSVRVVDPQEFQVRDTVRSVTGETLSETSSGKLVIRSGTRAAYEVGDVLIGDETQRWAKKVTAVDTVNGQTQLTVVDAELTDIMADGSTLGYSVTPDWGEAVIVGGKRHALQKPLAEYFPEPAPDSRDGRGDGRIDLGNTSLMDLVVDASGHVDWASSTVMGQALAEASEQDEAVVTAQLSQGRIRVQLDEGSELQIASSVDVDHTWSWLHGLTTDVEMNTTVAVDLKVTASFEGHVSAHVAWPLLPTLSAPITIPTTPPLYLSVDLEIPVGVVLDASGAVSTTFRQRAEYVFNVNMGYTPGGGFYCNPTEPQKDIHDPVVESAGLDASVSTEVYMEPTVSVKLYNIVGPLLWTHPYLRRETSFSRGVDTDESVLGITAGVGLELGNSLLGGTWEVRSGPILDFSRTRDLIGGGTTDGTSDSGANPPPGAAPPSITMTRPSAPETADDYVAIGWYDSDPDDNATISLWQDNDNSGYDGTLIATGIEEDWSGNTFFLPVGGMPEGKQFYVYATISDGLHSVNSTNYSAKITVDHPDEGTDFSFHCEYLEDDGNGNSIPEAGEEVELQLRLRNNADAEMTHVETYFSVQSADVDVLDDYDDYGTIAPGATEWGRFGVRLNSASETDVTFDVFVTYLKDGSPYHQHHSLTRRFPEPGTEGPEFVVDDVVPKDTTAESPRNDNDGVFESGESIGFDLYLRNVGTADALHVEAKVTNVHGEDGTLFDVHDGWEEFPNLAAGGNADKQDSGDFQDIWAPADFSGRILGDLTIRYGTAAIEQHLEGVELLNVQAEAWMSVSPVYDNFGITGSHEDVVLSVDVRNTGSEELTVTGAQVTGSPSDTSFPDTFPWVLQAGQTQSLAVTIETSGFDCESIVREVVFSSTGRIADVGEDDRVIIAGLVCDSIPFVEVPGSLNGFSPDVSGDWIVYSTNSVTGNEDVFAYQMSTGNTVQVTTDLGRQTDPRIYGNLIAWNDCRHWDGESDITYQGCNIYAYDLATGREFPVSSDPMSERLIGIDADSAGEPLICFSRVYDLLYDRDGNPFSSYPCNLHVCEYIGNGQVEERYGTSWNPASGHETRQTVDPKAGDVGGGLLVYERFEWTWVDNAHGGYWDRSEGVKSVKVIDYARGETGPTTAFSQHEHLYSADEHRFAFQRRYDDQELDEDGEQVWLWNDGAEQRLTSPGPDGDDYADEGLALGGYFVTYADDGPPHALLYWDLNAGTQGLLTQLDAVPHDPRMDGHTVVWEGKAPGSSEWRIYYAFLGAQLSIDPASILVHGTDQLVEGEPFSVTVTVANVGSWATTDDPVVSLYEGETPLGTPQSVTGGIEDGKTAQVDFANITLTEGEHTLRVECAPAAHEYTTDNAATKILSIQDTDTAAPIISNTTIAEHNGDDDEYIEDNEQVVVSWTLTDASGIGETTCKVDGIAVDVTLVGRSANQYQAIAGPFAVGSHTVEITGTDADDSPETMTPWIGSFTVHSHAPTVVTTTPAPGTIVEKLFPIIEVTFSAGLKSSSVTTDSVSLVGSDESIIPGTVSYVALQHKLVFLAAQQLAYSTTYSVRLTAGEGGVTDQIGNRLAADYVWSFTTLADTTPPVAEITSPADGARLLTQTSVLGTANDDNFQDYKIEYQGGAREWVEIATGTTPVQSGTLGTWDIAGVPDGQYTLRLTVTDNAVPAALVTEDSVQVVIDKNPPEVPYDPSPFDGGTDVSVNVLLDWEDSVRAASYDLYLWQSPYGKPGTPTVSSLGASQFAPQVSLAFGTTYNWEVVARNIIGDTSGPVWQFTTCADDDDLPDTWEQKIVDADPNDNIVSVADVLGEDDFDDDSLSNAEEYILGTDPTNPDSDGDGMADGWEVLNYLNPRSGDDAGTDPDGDGLTNLEEHDVGTNPWGRPLDIGWNLISFVSECDVPVSEHVVGPMWYWENGRYCALRDTRDDRAPEGEPSPVKPWRGYWLYVRTACEIDIRTGQVSGRSDQR